MKKKLKQGFSTGSAAAGGAKAAVMVLAGMPDPREVDIPLPIEGRLQIPVHKIEMNEQGISCTIIKDAGDDPDVTDKAEITAKVCLLDKEKGPKIEICGGKGVGTVTRQGLPVQVGSAAINPEPRKQIIAAIQEAFEIIGAFYPVKVILEVKNGDMLAQKTLNPRLGIVGGISILGTTGKVSPYSRKSYRDTISTALNVAKSMGLGSAVFSTGGRSERFIKDRLTEFPEAGFVQVADFFSFSLKKAKQKGFTKIYYSCFLGKLIKMAQGYPYTHAKYSRINFASLAEFCSLNGLEQDKGQEIIKANTARQVLSIILTSKYAYLLLKKIADQALASAQSYTGSELCVIFYLFDFEGRLLTTSSTRENHYE